MIQNSNEFLNAVLENISDGIVACNKDGVLTVFNSAIKRLHGLPLEPLPPTEWANHYNLYHEDGETIMQPKDIPLFRALSGEDVKEAPLMIKRKDGITKYALSSGKALKNKKGEIIGAVVSMRDVTESRIYKAELAKQNQELIKTNQELDRFVYSTSHELRSPLASILGLVELAKVDEADDDKLGLLEMIKRSVTRLDDFIEDINDYARNTRLDIGHKVINFKALIKDCILQLQHMENATNINFDVLVNNPQLFYGDQQRWRVVFNNFISNAIKYANVHQSNPKVEIEVHQEHENIVINITDNGLGIKGEHIQQIFKMFYRATSASTGTGLGLFIVNETIVKMGGNITVSSIYGKGTSFKIEVPYFIKESTLLS